MEQFYFTGTILPWAAAYVPPNWMLCVGQTLNIAQYQELYVTISTMFGGDGKTTFALPNLQAVTPAQCGSSGESARPDVPFGGLVNAGGMVQMTNQNLPCHSHDITGNGSGVAQCGMAVAVGTDATSEGPVPGGTMGTPMFQAVQGGEGNVPQNLFLPMERDTPGLVSLGGVSLDGSITLAPAGNQGSVLNVMPPYQVINYIICTNGIFWSGSNLSAPLGTIIGWAGQQIPNGWQPCLGQSASVSANPALFRVLGNAYGGDGVINFSLPNLAGRVTTGANSPQAPVPNSYELGKPSGVTSLMITEDLMPTHTHVVQSDLQITFNGSSSEGTSSTLAAGSVLATVPPLMNGNDLMYQSLAYMVPPGPPATFQPLGVASIEDQGTWEVGGNYPPADAQEPVSTLTPCLGINYIICVKPPPSQSSADPSPAVAGA